MTRFDTSRITTLFDMVLIEFERGDAFSAGGILLTESEQSKINGAARVLKVGPGGPDTRGRPRMVPPDIYEGARVIALRYAGTVVPGRGNDRMRLISASEILAVIEEDAAVVVS